MSIFGKVILDEIARNHPERLAYYQHTDECTWYKPCSCALGQFARRNPHKPATKTAAAAAAAAAPQKTIRALFVVPALSAALYSAAFFYRWSVK